MTVARRQQCARSRLLAAPVRSRALDRCLRRARRLAGRAPRLEARPDRPRRCARACTAAADPGARVAGRRQRRRQTNTATSRVTGRFLHDRETLVQAVTDAGRGYWVLTPLRTTTAASCWSTAASCRRNGATRDAPRRPIAARSTVTGLLRIDGAEGRVSARQRSRGRPLVFARRRGDRRRARPRARRALLHRCRRRPQSRRLSDRRPDRGRVSRTTT